jgi:DhnA family fructose-bisphosphate aldolase class Ia
LLLIIAIGFVADLDAVNVAEIAAEIGSDIVKSEFARRFLGGFTGYCVEVAV